MNVNPNVYGTSENWITASKVANTTLRITNFKNLTDKEGTTKYYSSSIGQAVYLDLINPERAEIDDSISPWNVSEKSILFNPKIPLGENNYAEIFEGKRKLFLFYYTAIKGLNGVRNVNKIPYNFDKYYSFGTDKNNFLNTRYNTNWDGGDVYDQLDYIPFVDFSYRDVILLGRILCGGGNQGNGDFTIKRYYDSETTDYPYIYGIYFDVYIRSTSTNQYVKTDAINLVNGGKVNCKDVIVSNGSFELPQMDGYYVYNCTPYSRTASLHEWFKLTYDESTNTVNQYAYCVNGDERFTTVVTGSSGSGNLYKIRVHHSEFSREDALKEIAYLGFWFAESKDLGIGDANSGLFGESDNLFLPEFDGTNTTTGAFRYGEDVKNLPNFNYGNMSEVVINTGEEDAGDLTTNLNIKALTGGKHYYWLTESQFEQFIQFLNSSEITDVDFYGKNPADYISNVTYYPFKLFPDWFPNKLKFRGIDTGIDVEENYLTYGYAYSYQMAITPYFDDFRDYPPYSTAKLFTILGSTDIDLEFFMNHVLKVNFYFDISTGTCNAFIFRDDLFVEMLSGKYGANINFLAENTGQYQNTMAMYEYSQKQNNINYMQNSLNNAINVSKGDLLNVNDFAFNTIDYQNQTKLNDYQTTHTPPTVANVGTISSVNNMISQYIPKLIVSHCKMLEYDEEIYAHNVGHACNLNGVVSDFSGYTVCANVNCDNISATPQEINMIKTICCNGFYI